MQELTRPVFFTPTELALITIAIDSWQEGTEVAKGITTVDPTVQTADELNDLMSGYDDDLVTCQSIRKRVTQWSAAPNINPRTLLLLPVCIYTASRLIRVCFGKRRP